MKFTIPALNKKVEQQMFDSANSFYEAALRCVAPKINPDGTITAPHTPAIVSLVFACELYLKALIKIDGGAFGRTHNLLKLFEKLPENFTQQILKEYDTIFSKMPLRVTGSFESRIQEISEAFIKWRYNFEYTELQINMAYLFVLGRALYKFIRELKKWEVTPETEDRMLKSAIEFSEIMKLPDGSFLKATFTI